MVAKYRGSERLLPGAALFLLGIYSACTTHSANPLAFSQFKPDLTNLPELNLWATIAFAFAGFELCSTMGHEIKDPQRNLRSSI